MPKRLTDKDRIKLDGIIEEMTANGESDSDIQFVVDDFKNMYGIDDSEKKNSTNGSLVESASQSKPTSPAPNGQSQSQKGFVESLKEFYSAPPQKTSFEEKSTAQKGISLLKGRSNKPIDFQEKEKKRDSQDVISYASKKLASTFSRGDKNVEEQLTTTIEEGLKSGNYNDVYDFYEEKKSSDDFVRGANQNEVIRVFQEKSDKYKNNPLELSIYQTTKEGKIGQLITDIQSGKKLQERDIEYLKQNAPIAYKDMLRSVEQYSTDFPIQNINTVAEINRKRNDLNMQVSGQENIKQSLQAFSPLIQEDSLGIGLMNSKLTDVKKRYDEELKKLDALYPQETYQVKTADGYDTRLKPQPKEYLEKKSELEQAKNELLSKAGQLESVYYGKRNPNSNATDIGAKFLQVSSPNMYDLYKKAVNSKGFEADITKMGIDIMLSSGDPNLIAKAKVEQSNFNDKYPEWKERDVLRKIGIEYYKAEGISSISNKTMLNSDEAEKYINQLSSEDRDFYYKNIKPKYSTKLPTLMLGGVPTMDRRTIPIPNAGGVINKFLEGMVMPIKGTANLIGNIAESEQEKAQRALMPQRITDEELVSKENINKEIDTLIKKDKLNAYDAKRLSELYTQQSMKSDAQRLADGSFLVAGQVFTQGLVGNALGGGIGSALGRASTLTKGLGYINQAEKIATLASDLTKMSNFGSGTFAFLSSYDDASLEVERLAPNANPLFKTAYASTVGLLNAGTEAIFRDAKIFDAFKKEVAPTIASLVSNLSTGNITEEVFRSQVSNVLKKELPRFLGNVVKEDVKEAIEEATTEGGTLVAKLAGVALGQINPEEVNIEEGIDAIGQVFKQTAIDGLLVAGLAGRAETLKSRTTQKALYELAQDPSKFIDVVTLQQNEGKMSVEDATEKIKLARTLNEVATKIIPALEKRVTLNENQKVALTTLLTLEKKLEYDLANPENKQIKSVIESQLAQIKNKKEGILSGEYIVDENFNALTPDELKQKVQDEKDYDLELQKQFSKVNTNPQLALITEVDGTFSVMNNDTKESGFKTKDEAQKRILELSGISYTPSQEMGEQIEVSVAQPTSTTQSEIEDKKADIERRRQEELLDKFPNKLNPQKTKGLDFGNALTAGIPKTYQQILDALLANTNIIAGLPSKEVDLLKPLFDKGLIKSKEDVYTRLNAPEIHDKYDAELKAVEQQYTTQSESSATLNNFVERIKAGEKMTSPEDLQYYQNNAKEIESLLSKEQPKTQNNEIPPTQQETIEATNTEVATDIGQQEPNAPIKEEGATDSTQSEIGIHESAKGVMNGMNVTIERKEDGNYIYTMLGDKIPFTKEQHDELVQSKELLITKTNNNAPEITSSKKMDAYKSSTDGEKMGSGNAKEQAIATEGKTTTPTQKEKVSERTPTTTIPREPIQPKGTSEREAKEGTRSEVQPSTERVSPATTETATPVLEQPKQNIEQNEQPRIAEDANEQQLAEGKLAKQDNPIQEPNIEAIEGKAESDNEAKLNEAIEEADRLINNATDVVNVPISDIKTNEKEYQGRKNKFSERSANNVATNFDKNKFDPIIVYKHSDGNTYVLSGHSRLEGMRRRGEKTIPSRYFEGTDAEARDFALKSNKLGTLQTDLENADYYRKQIEDGKSYNAVLTEAKENEQEGSAVRIIDYAHLNPKGKAYQALESLEKGESDSSTNIKLVAQKVGRIRSQNPHLTNAHEEELFNYFLENGYPTDKEIQDQNGIINRSINAVRFDNKEPLNLNKFVNKTAERIEWERELKELETLRDELKKEVNPSKKTGWTGLKERTIASIAKGKSVEEINQAEKDFNDNKNDVKTNYEKKLAEQKQRLQVVSDKIAKHLLREKSLIEGIKNQGALFSASTKPPKSITKKAFDKLVGTLKKAFPNTNVFTSTDALRSKLNEYGLSETLFNAIGLVGSNNIQGATDSFQMAEDMDSRGIDNESIFSETGWYKDSLDGEWRYELSDEGITFEPSNKDSKLSSKQEFETTLGAVIKFPDFFKAYPEAKNIKVKFTKLNQNEKGSFDPKTNEIEINSTSPRQEQFSFLRHEMQHYIQEREGFAKGASPRNEGLLRVERERNAREAKLAILRGNLTSLSPLDKSRSGIESEIANLESEIKNLDENKESWADYFYKAYAGEIEARAIQKRIWLNKEGLSSPNKFKDKFRDSDITIQFMQTPKGIVYGAKFPDGSVYVNPDYLSSEVLTHEFSHLWESYLPKQWAEGLSTFKDTIGFKKALKEIQDNPAYANKTPEEQASEALNTLIGRKGEGYYRSGVVLSKFKAWVDKFFKTLGDKIGKALGIKGLQLTPDDKLGFFVNKVLGDLLGGEEIVQENVQPETSDIRYMALPNGDVANKIDTIFSLSENIQNAKTTSEARKATEEYDSELKKDAKLNFIMTNFTSITDQLQKLNLITKKGDC